MQHGAIATWRTRAIAAVLLTLVGVGTGAPLLAQEAVPKSSPGASLDQLRVTAQMRMRRDRESFTREQLQEIERLYQSTNGRFFTPESRATLEDLIARFPGSNRAGCAALYLARVSPEAEREAALLNVIAHHADAWYGDGTQVGPLARAYLASWYYSKDRKDEALAIAKVIATETPDAVDHTGRRIVDVLKGSGVLQ